MMRHLLLCGGTDGRPEALQWLASVVAARRPDGILFVGGAVDPFRRCVPRDTPWSLSQEDLRFMEKVFSTLGQLGVFTAIIPSLPGVPMDEFLQVGMNAERNYSNIHLAHGRLVEKDGIAVTGLGAVVAEHALSGIESMSRTMANYFLQPLTGSRQPRKVLLLPAPPTGSLGGPHGLSLIGELIDSIHPDLCVVAGDSAHRGSQQVAHTLIVNPGRLADGWAAWLDWDKPRGEQVEIVHLDEPVAPGALAGAI